MDYLHLFPSSSRSLRSRQLFLYSFVALTSRTVLKLVYIFSAYSNDHPRVRGGSVVSTPMWAGVLAPCCSVGNLTALTVVGSQNSRSPIPLHVLRSKITITAVMTDRPHLKETPRERLLTIRIKAAGPTKPTSNGEPKYQTIQSWHSPV